MTKNNKMLEKIITFGGNSSQTGVAVKEKLGMGTGEWRQEDWTPTKEFLEIGKSLEKEDVLAFLPIWNSHKGEIKRDLINMVFDQKVKIKELWPGKISFECIRKRGKEKSEYKKIVSVFAALNQCSKFINKVGATFKDESNTGLAMKAFLDGDEYDTFLGAPGQCFGEEVVKVHDDVSNPLNFTSFALMGNVEREFWDFKKYPALKKISKNNNLLSGIEMKIPEPTIGEEEGAILERLSDGANSIDDIPKAIFVLKLDGWKCRILFEAKKQNPLNFDSMTELNCGIQ